MGEFQNGAVHRVLQVKVDLTTPLIMSEFEWVMKL